MQKAKSEEEIKGRVHGQSSGTDTAILLKKKGDPNPLFLYPRLINSSET